MRMLTTSATCVMVGQALFNRQVQASIVFVTLCKVGETVIVTEFKINPKNTND